MCLLGASPSAGPPGGSRKPWVHRRCALSVHRWETQAQGGPAPVPRSHSHPTGFLVASGSSGLGQTLQDCPGRDTQAPARPRLARGWSGGPCADSGCPRPGCAPRSAGIPQEAGALWWPPRAKPEPAVPGPAAGRGRPRPGTPDRGGRQASRPRFLFLRKGSTSAVKPNFCKIDTL